MQYGVAGSHEDQDHVEMLFRKRRGSSQATSASSTPATTTATTGARVGPMQRRMSAFGQSDAAKDYIFTAYRKR
jgi:hypothetical protein